MTSGNWLLTFSYHACPDGYSAILVAVPPSARGNDGGGQASARRQPRCTWLACRVSATCAGPGVRRWAGRAVVASRGGVTLRDPDLIVRAQRAAAELERAWDRWRTVHGLGTGPPPPVSSYVGYSLDEPWGQPRVVLGIAAQEAEQLTALLERHDCAGPVYAAMTSPPGTRAERDASGRAANLGRASAMGWVSAIRWESAMHWLSAIPWLARMHGICAMRLFAFLGKLRQVPRGVSRASQLRRRSYSARPCLPTRGIWRSPARRPGPKRSLRPDMSCRTCEKASVWAPSLPRPRSGRCTSLDRARTRASRLPQPRSSQLEPASQAAGCGSAACQGATRCQGRSAPADRPSEPAASRKAGTERAWRT